MDVEQGSPTLSPGCQLRRRLPWPARPIVHALSLAVVAMVALAAFATQVRPDAGSTASPSLTSSRALSYARPTPASNEPTPTPSPLTSLQLFGQPVPTETVLLSGTPPRLLDLPAGRLRDIPGSEWPSRVLALPDGRLLCVCVEFISTQDGETASVRLAVLGRDGVPGATTPLEQLVGRRDPRVPEDELGPSVQLSAALSPDGSLVFIGRSVRQPREWIVGIEVVAVDSARVVGSFELARRPSNQSDETLHRGRPSVAPTPSLVGGIYVSPPNIAVSPHGRDILFSVAEVRDNTVAWQGHFMAAVSRGTMRAPRPFPSAKALADPDSLVGRCGGWAFADEGRLIRLCTADASGHGWVVERLGLDDRIEAPIDLGVGPSFVWGLALDRGGLLWLWDPFSRWLARVDVADGTVERRQLSVSSASHGNGPAALLGGVAAWIAPSAAAKMIVEPALALSPDGRRLYALVAAGSSPESPGGSAGILVIDAATMEVVDRWLPVADLMSIALSRDGRFVYAAGLPGVDATGREVRSWPASVSVYDAETGELRLIAGDLGAGSWLTFPATADPWSPPGS